MEELRDISEPTMVATERTIKMSFRILGYSVRSARKTETARARSLCCSLG